MCSPDLGQEFFHNILQLQADRCEQEIIEVRELAFRESGSSEKLDLIGDILSEVDDMTENTKDLFANPDRIGDIHRHLRRILINMAEDFGYKQKLYDENNNIEDNISTLFYWFRLIAKPNLGSDFREVEHEYAIHECRRKRNEVEHGGSGERTRPDGIAVGVLAWYALHEMLWNWKRAQRQIIHGHLTRIEDDDLEYGFICKLNDVGGDGAPHSITRYRTGEEGNNISFNLEDVENFPSLGAVVTFTEPETGGTPVATDISVI